MKTIIFIIFIAIAEFTLSWLNHRINILVMTRKTFQATRYDILANTLAEAIPYFIYVESQNWIYLIPRIVMNTLGTWVAASRKRNRKLYRKKQPFTSA